MKLFYETCNLLAKYLAHYHTICRPPFSDLLMFPPTKWNYSVHVPSPVSRLISPCLTIQSLCFTKISHLVALHSLCTRLLHLFLCGSAHRGRGGWSRESKMYNLGPRFWLHCQVFSLERDPQSCGLLAACTVNIHVQLCTCTGSRRMEKPQLLCSMPAWAPTVRDHSSNKGKKKVFRRIFFQDWIRIWLEH